MEWNFLFRIDHLKEQGEERNLKGVIFTERDQTPTHAQIHQFLQECGYHVQLEDPNKLIFLDSTHQDPVRISIVEIGNNNKDQVQSDQLVKMLSEQFRKGDYSL